MKTNPIASFVEPAFIRIDNLSVTYPGGREALRGISLAIRRGESLVLLGKSGAGKSTLLRCINGLQRPTGGAIRVAGIGRLGENGTLKELRRRTGMVFQLHHLIGRHTALQNVLMGRVGYHSPLRTLFPLPASDVRLAMECLDRVGLVDKAMQRADSLSGGERQRVGIARALAQEPGIILADEPVASLDPATALSIMELLHRISREDGLTVVFSLHQIDFACSFGERIIGLAGGEIVFDGRPAELTENPLGTIYHGSSTCEAHLDVALQNHAHKERKIYHEKTMVDLSFDPSSM
ncbi:MAG: phosphonate ABC transporter ATP-binding protein [Desulfobacteraceae bacterium]|nr:MAG: phosphonate ABC transporter ATP-binding protein [Desulfobacteraceae bacterium]